MTVIATLIQIAAFACIGLGVFVTFGTGVGLIVSGVELLVIGVAAERTSEAV